MSGLLIQHARWQGELVTPDDTRLEVGLKCGCVCIECGEPLVLRCGEKKRRHFAHRAETSCSGETYVHEVVKTWIAEKLPGQIIPLLPHPELDSPQGFRVEKGWQEKRSEETYRKYDVVLEGMFLYEKAGQEKRGCLIFEVYYSNAKDDDFKLQMQKEGSYILEINAKKFYGDGRDNLTAERLVENSHWVWFTDHQIEEQKRERIRKQNWPGYNSKKDLREIVGGWIAKLTSVYFNFGNHIWNGPFRECDVGFYEGDLERTVPWYFAIEKRWQNKYSQKTGRTYDIVFEGRFMGRLAKNTKRGHLIFQLVDQFNAYDNDFKLEIQKAKFCVLEVDIHGFFGDGLEHPTPERLIENSRWVWFTDEQNSRK